MMIKRWQKWQWWWWLTQGCRQQWWWVRCIRAESDLLQVLPLRRLGKKCPLKWNRFLFPVWEKKFKRKLNLSKYFEHFLWTCPCWNAKDEGDCVESHHFWPPNLLSILALIIKEAYENNLLPTQLNSSLNVSFSSSFGKSTFKNKKTTSAMVRRPS